MTDRWEAFLVGFSGSIVNSHLLQEVILKFTLACMPVVTFTLTFNQSPIPQPLVAQHNQSVLQAVGYTMWTCSEPADVGYHHRILGGGRVSDAVCVTEVGFRTRVPRQYCCHDQCRLFWRRIKVEDTARRSSIPVSRAGMEYGGITGGLPMLDAPTEALRYRSGTGQGAAH